MPVVVRAVGGRIHSNDSRWPGSIFSVEQQQLHGRRIPREYAEVDAHLIDGGAQRRGSANRSYGMGHAFTFQMSAAYSAIVRSLENFPELATFRIALCAHAPGSAYKAPSRS